MAEQLMERGACIRDIDQRFGDNASPALGFPSLARYEAFGVIKGILAAESGNKVCTNGLRRKMAAKPAADLEIDVYGRGVWVNESVHRIEDNRLYTWRHHRVSVSR